LSVKWLSTLTLNLLLTLFDCEFSSLSSFFIRDSGSGLTRTWLGKWIYSISEIYFYKPSYLVQKSGDMLLHVTAGKLICPDNHGQIYWWVNTEYNTLRCYKVFNPIKISLHPSYFVWKPLTLTPAKAQWCCLHPTRKCLATPPFIKWKSALADNNPHWIAIGIYL
jgi:hypothetical protein